MANSKVVWTEGMLLTPQHFQKSENYLENFAKDLICESSLDILYGVKELELDTSLLGLGKFGVKRAVGIFKDGTPFRLEHELVLDIPEGTSHDIVYLAIPVYKEGNQIIKFGDNVNTRYKSYDSEVYDNTESNGEQIHLEVAELNISLKLGSSKLDNYLVIPIAEISEFAMGGTVVLNNAFIPQCIDAKISTYISENISYIYDKLQYRLSVVSKRLNVTNNKSYQSMIRDFLWMSALSGWSPIWKELALNKNERISPKKLYFYCISMLGKMYGLEGKLVPDLELWNDEKTYSLFSKVFGMLHECLREVQSDNVTTLPWDTSLFASRHLLRTFVRDRSLYSDSRFILVITSSYDMSLLITDFPKGCKIASNSEIANIVLNALSGVPLRNLPFAPSELKTKINAAYFEIDTNSELWQNIINNDEPIALHIDDRFKDITVELHIIK